MFFAPCALPQADTSAPAVLVDKIYTGRLEGSTDYVKRRASRPADPIFQLMNSDSSNTRAVGELLLAPTKKASSGSTLS